MPTRSCWLRSTGSARHPPRCLRRYFLYFCPAATGPLGSSCRFCLANLRRVRPLPLLTPRLSRRLCLATHPRLSRRSAVPSRRNRLVTHPPALPHLPHLSRQYGPHLPRLNAPAGPTSHPGPIRRSNRPLGSHPHQPTKPRDPAPRTAHSPDPHERSRPADCHPAADHLPNHSLNQPSTHDRNDLRHLIPRRQHLRQKRTHQRQAQQGSTQAPLPAASQNLGRVHPAFDSRPMPSESSTPSPGTTATPTRRRRHHVLRFAIHARPSSPVPSPPTHPESTTNPTHQPQTTTPTPPQGPPHPSQPLHLTEPTALNPPRLDICSAPVRPSDRCTSVNSW